MNLFNEDHCRYQEIAWDGDRRLELGQVAVPVDTPVEEVKRKSIAHLSSIRPDLTFDIERIDDPRIPVGDIPYSMRFDDDDWRTSTMLLPVFAAVLRDFAFSPWDLHELLTANRGLERDVRALMRVDVHGRDYNLCRFLVSCWFEGVPFAVALVYFPDGVVPNCSIESSTVYVISGDRAAACGRRLQQLVMPYRVPHVAPRMLVIDPWHEWHLARPE